MTWTAGQKNPPSHCFLLWSASLPLSKWAAAWEACGSWDDTPNLKKRLELQLLQKLLEYDCGYQKENLFMKWHLKKIECVFSVIWNVILKPRLDCKTSLAFFVCGVTGRSGSRCWQFDAAAAAQSPLWGQSQDDGRQNTAALCRGQKIKRADLTEVELT